MNIDLKQFWIDDDIAHKDNCFSDAAPQIALGIRMSDECVFSELGVQGDPWGNNTPPSIRVELNKRYNDKAEKIVGKRLLSEEYRDPDAEFPYIKRIGEVFGGTYQYIQKGGEWLTSNIKTIDALEKRLDFIEKLDLETFLFPENWQSEKTRIYEKYGKKPNIIHGIRGPVTLATSIYGVENLVFLYYDAKEVFMRFSHVIGETVLKIAKIMDREAGYDETTRPSGFFFCDDDCCLLTAEMYQEFGYPILKKLFDEYSPNEGDQRYQHSDSAMEHLLPILSKLNLTGCNFGPTVTVDKIRAHMPRTRIDGCIAPFTFMNNDKEQIQKEVVRDFEMTRDSGIKGLNLTTAGSINDGSSLESMRFIMELIQNHCRY